jgi:hypothetical protein
LTLLVLGSGSFKRSLGGIDAALMGLSSFPKVSEFWLSQDWVSYFDRAYKARLLSGFISSTCVPFPFRCSTCYDGS